MGNQSGTNKIVEWKKCEHKECSFVIEVIVSTMYRQHVWWWLCVRFLLRLFVRTRVDFINSATLFRLVSCFVVCVFSTSSSASIYSIAFYQCKKVFALIFKYVQRLFWFSTVGNQIIGVQMPRKWKTKIREQHNNMKIKLQIYAN